VAPGVTSIASIIYCDEETLLSQDTLESIYVNVIMPDKLRLDMEYVAHRSFLVDLDILFRTRMVLLPRFARAAPEVEEILFGPVQRFIRRRLSWFTLDLILGLGAVSAACHRSALERLQPPVTARSDHLQILFPQQRDQGRRDARAAQGPVSGNA
jgi:hypothetical protein